MVRLVTGTGIAIALLIGAVGCSYRGPKACDVFDAATAKSLLGTGAYIGRNIVRSPELSQCEWDGKGGAVTVWVGQWDEVDPGFDSEKPVPNLGDEAWKDPGEIYVRKGNAGLSVMSTVIGDNPAENLKVAKLLLPRL